MGVYANQKHVYQLNSTNQIHQDQECQKVCGWILFGEKTSNDSESLCHSYMLLC